MPTERNARESSAERASPAADDRAITVETPFVPVGELPSGIVAAVSSLRFAWFSITEWLLFAWLWIVLALSFVFVGLLLMPRTLDLAERAARRQRAWAYRLPGVPVVATYRPLPADVDPADWRSTMQRLRDPTVRRDLIWALVNPTVGLVLSLLPAWLMYHGIRGLVEVAIVLTTGLVSPLGTWFGMPIDHSTWWIVGLVAPVEAVVGYVVARPLLRLHGRWVRLVLGGDAPSELQAALQAALTHVRQTRRTALELQEAEIARIERDLHDGAQARLVAMGMTLSQVSELVRENPDAAIASIERAKGDASAALDELRGLVRGIRPPVLADRGLGRGGACARGRNPRADAGDVRPVASARVAAGGGAVFRGRRARDQRGQACRRVAHHRRVRRRGARCRGDGRR